MSDPLYHVRTAVDKLRDTCSASMQNDLDRAYQVLVAYRDLGTVNYEKLPQASQNALVMLEYLQERGGRVAAIHDRKEKARALKDEQHRLKEIHLAAEEEDDLVYDTQADRNSNSTVKNGVKTCYNCSMPMRHPSKCIWPCNSIARGVECPHGKRCHYRHHAPALYTGRRGSINVGNVKIPIIIDCIQEDESDSVRVYINPKCDKNKLSRPLVDALYAMAVKEHHAGPGQWILGTCNIRVKKINVVYLEAFHHCPQCEKQ